MEAYHFAVITQGGQVSNYRYTDGPLTLSQGGQSWAPFPWVRGGFSRIAPDGALTLSAPEIPFPYSNTDRIEVQIYTCRDLDVGASVITCGEFKPLVLAELAGVETSESGVSMEFWNGLPLNPNDLSRKFTKKCPFVFGDVSCGIWTDPYRRHHQIIDQHGPWLRSSEWAAIVPSANNWITDARVDQPLLTPGDYIVRPHLGSRIEYGLKVAHVVGFATQVDGVPWSQNQRWIQIYPQIDITPLDTIAVYPNCDKSYLSCRQFSNSDRFGGWQDLLEPST